MQRARLFGPAIFEASKLKVLFVGVDEEKHPGKLPRTYTLTHSDVTARLTLAVSHTIHAAQLQGWYNRLQRDEVVAEWKKVQGAMSLHVHCHISGGHFLLDLIAPLRYYIFRKELPVVRPNLPTSIAPLALRGHPHIHIVFSSKATNFFALRVFLATNLMANFFSIMILHSVINTQCLYVRVTIILASYSFNMC